MGRSLRLDWDSKRVLAKTPITSSRPERAGPEPSGKHTRRSRDQHLGDRVHVASYDQIRTFDLDLAPVSVVSNGLMAGLHEVLMVTDGRLWVSATAIDAALEVDLTTGECVSQFWPCEEPVFQRVWSLTAADIDKSADLRTAFLSSSHTEHPSHLHLNALAIRNGHIHALFNSKGAVVDLETREVVLSDEQLVGGHNLVVDGNLLFVCATRRKSVCIFDLTSGSRVADLSSSRRCPRSSNCSTIPKPRDFAACRPAPAAMPAIHFS